jgi:hypothetical protein
MMNTIDLIPDNRNRIAYWLGRIFHPYFVCIPTLLAVLNGLGWQDALAWSALVLLLVLGPGIVFISYLRRQEKWIYQRQTRGPVYIVVWLSVLFCVAVLLLLDAPRVLAACIATLAVWLPLQLLFNTYVTKISTHAAVLAGCATGLWWLGKLQSPLLQVAIIAIMLLTLWSRLTTKNHTLFQFALGLLVGGGSVLIAFPLLLS